MAAPAMVREGGEVWLGLQVQHHFGDPSRDLGGRARQRAGVAEAEPGDRRAHRPARPRAAAAGPGRRRPLDVTVHDGFDFWVADVADDAADRGRPRAGQRRRLPDRPADRASTAAYWTDVGDQGAPALGDAAARGRAARRPRAAARGRARPARRRTPGWWGCSAPTACSCRSGTCRSAPAPRLSRSRPRVRRRPGRGAGRRLRLTSEERAARAGLANRQVTLRS